jgi:hypothetical protein
MHDIEATPNAEAETSETTEVRFADSSAQALASIKTLLVGGNQKVTFVYKTAREGILEIQEVANRLVAMGGGAAKAGNAVLAGLEKSAAILDLGEVMPIFRDAYGSVSAVISAAQAAVEKAEDEANDAEETCEMIRAQLQNATDRYNQLIINRPVSDLYPSVDGACDSFNVLNAAESVKTRIRIINDNATGAIGVAVVLSSTTDDNAIQAFYFTDYINLCDKILGRKLDLSSSNDGSFVYKAVMNIAVATADAVVSAFGSINADLIDVGTDDRRGLRFPSDVVTDVVEATLTKDNGDSVESAEINDLLEGSTDAEIDEAGEVVVEESPSTEGTDEQQEPESSPESEIIEDADGFCVEADPDIIEDAAPAETVEG